MKAIVASERNRRNPPQRQWKPATFTSQLAAEGGALTFTRRSRANQDTANTNQPVAGNKNSRRKHHLSLWSLCLGSWLTQPPMLHDRRICIGARTKVGRAFWLIEKGNIARLNSTRITRVLRESTWRGQRSHHWTAWQTGLAKAIKEHPYRVKEAQWFEESRLTTMKGILDTGTPQAKHLENYWNHLTNDATRTHWSVCFSFVRNWQHGVCSTRHGTNYCLRFYTVD